MKKFSNILIAGVLLIGLHISANAQVQTIFQPAVNGRTTDGITLFQVNNQTGSDFRSSLKIIITEEKIGRICEISVAPIQVKRGINMFNRSLLGGAQMKFASNNFGNIVRQTGRLPEGEYEYCYELTPLEEKAGVLDFYENCFHLNLQPLSPLMLVDPVDEEKICNVKPSFIWQPPMPVDVNARYRIVVVELKEKQTPAEALSFNLPIINAGELAMPRINYPQNIPALVKGKKYAWQVLYSVQNMLVTRSEIWTFKIDCEEEKTFEPGDSYRELQTMISGDFYVAKRVLRFAVNNPYAAGELDYTIVQLKEGKPIQNLPRLKLLAGQNKYDLDLTEFRAFVHDENYQLTVRLPNGQNLYLRFIYQE